MKQEKRLTNWVVPNDRNNVRTAAQEIEQPQDGAQSSKNAAERSRSAVELPKKEIKFSEGLLKKAHETEKFFQDRKKAIDAGIEVSFNKRAMQNKALEVMIDKDLFACLDAMAYQLVADICDIANGMVKTMGVDLDKTESRGRGR